MIKRVLVASVMSAALFLSGCASTPVVNNPPPVVVPAPPQGWVNSVISLVKFGCGVEPLVGTVLKIWSAAAGIAVDAAAGLVCGVVQRNQQPTVASSRRRGETADDGRPVLDYGPVNVGGVPVEILVKPVR